MWMGRTDGRQTRRWSKRDTPFTFTHRHASFLSLLLAFFPMFFVPLSHTNMSPYIQLERHTDCRPMSYTKGLWARLSLDGGLSRTWGGYQEQVKEYLKAFRHHLFFIACRWMTKFCSWGHLQCGAWTPARQCRAETSFFERMSDTV